MLQNYLKISWRNLKRNRSYTIINIAGLAVALAVFIIISLFVRHEFSYDQFFSQTNQLYRVVMMNKQAATASKTQVQIPEPIAGELKRLYPEVKHSVRVSGPYNDRLLEGKNKLYTNKYAQVGPSYFKIFNFAFISGNATTALQKPTSIVITKELAEKLFSSEPALGKTIRVDNQQDYTVTGIIRKPSNTHFDIAAFALRNAKAYNNLPSNVNKWNIYTNQTYLKLSKAGQAASLQSKLPVYVKEHKPKPKRGQVATPPKLILQPVTDIHLHPQIEPVTAAVRFTFRYCSS